MKTIVLHGEDEIRSKKRLGVFISEAKKRGWNIILFDKESKSQLSEIISSADLFNNERIVIVKNFKNISIQEKKWIFGNIDKYNGVIVFYSDSILTQKDLKMLPKSTKLEEFTLPKKIFDFLNSFYPSNSKACLKLFHEVIERNPPEWVFALLSKTVRDLYWVKTSPSDIYYPSWRVQRLENQASRYKVNMLKEIIKILSFIDIEVKNSRAELIPSLDLLILSKLE